MHNTAHDNRIHNTAHDNIMHNTAHDNKIYNTVHDNMIYNTAHDNILTQDAVAVHAGVNDNDIHHAASYLCTAAVPVLPIMLQGDQNKNLTFSSIFTHWMIEILVC